MSIIKSWETDFSYAQHFNPYQWTSHGDLSPYRYGGMDMQVSSPKVPTLLFGREEFGNTIAIHGPKRTGKTLLAVFIITMRIHEEWSQITDVLTNVPFDWTSIDNWYRDVWKEDIKISEKCKMLTDIEQIKDIEHGIIFIDEIRRYADSYMTASQQSRFVSNLLADTGKQSCDLIYTDQSMNGPPSRVRVNVDWVMSPLFSERTGWCKVYVFDSLQNYDLFFNPMIPGMPASKPIYEYMFDGSQFFKYYDTRRKIEQYHFKFKPERFVKNYEDWHAGHYPDQPTSKKLLIYWNHVEGMQLSTKELQSMYLNMDFEGKIQ